MILGKAFHPLSWRTFVSLINHMYSEELAAKYSTDDSPVSLIQFMAWNPHLQGACDRPNLVQRVCKGLVVSMNPIPTEDAER